MSPNGPTVNEWSSPQGARTARHASWAATRRAALGAATKSATASSRAVAVSSKARYVGTMTSSARFWNTRSPLSFLAAISAQLTTTARQSKSAEMAPSHA
jgi:hypothetical protein